MLQKLIFSFLIFIKISTHGSYVRVTCEVDFVDGGGHAETEIVPERNFSQHEPIVSQEDDTIELSGHLLKESPPIEGIAREGLSSKMEKHEVDVDKILLGYRKIIPPNNRQKREEISPSNRRTIELIEREKFEEFDEKLTFTCSQRCGKLTKRSPCSCSATCVLYDNCCENITHDCPDVVREGHAKYSCFLDKVRCDNWQVYTILSGPDDPLVAPRITGSGGITVPQSDIKHFLQNAPVIDSVLGLTFSSRAFYDVYKDALNLTGDLFTWNLQIGHYASDFSNKSDLVNKVASSIYRPMFYERILNEHRCRLDVRDSCADRSLTASVLTDEEFNFYAQKCNEFTGIIRHAIAIYKNKYCAYCSGNRAFVERFELDSVLPVVRHNQDLFVLMSLSDDGTYLLQIDSEIKDQNSWSTATCSNFDNIFTLCEQPPWEKTSGSLEVTTGRNGKGRNEPGAESEEDSVYDCRATNCGDPRFKLDSDGMCRADYFILVGFKDNEKGFSPLICQSAMHRIGDFISCSLELTLKDGPWNNVRLSNNEVTMAQELKSNETLYFARITFSSWYRIEHENMFRFGRESTSSNIHKLAIAVKDYERYRASVELCPASQIGQDSNGDYRATDFNLTGEMLEGWGYKDYIINTIKYKEMVPLRGDVIDNENTTLLCFTKVSHADETLGLTNIGCLEDFVYKGDEDEINKLLATPYVDYFQLKAIAAFLRPVVIVLMGIVCSLLMNFPFLLN